MNSAQKPDKRIVSKGDYVAAQTSRTLFRVSALSSVVTAAVCVILAVSLPFAGMGTLGLGVSLCFALLAARQVRWSLLKMRKAAQIEQVIPRTRANVAARSDSQSLVRAAEEPLQTPQQAVLLRAAGAGHETPPEQLVRPAVPLFLTPGRNYPVIQETPTEPLVRASLEQE